MTTPAFWTVNSMYPFCVGEEAMPMGDSPFPIERKLGELAGDVLESLLVLLVHEGQTEGLDVLRLHLGDDLDDLHGHGHVRVFGNDLL